MIPGAVNCRDLGGLQTGRGRIRERALIRSAAPLGPSPRRVEALAALGLRTAIDLREPVERRHDPVGVSEVGLDVLTLPLIAGEVDLRTSRGLAEFYVDVLAVCGSRIARVVNVLAEPGAMPAIVFCAAGKDRTGLLCGILLSAIGVPDAEVAADYARSAGAMSGRFRAELEVRAAKAGIDEQALAVKLGAPPELMLEVLADLGSRYGGAAGYLRAHGTPTRKIDALRSHLIA